MFDKFPIIDTSLRDAFLALFESHYAGSLTEVFLDCGPRAGIVMPADVMGAVVYYLRSLILSSDDPEVQDEWREILLIVAEHWELAEAFADYCVRYSALPEPYRLALQRKDKSGGVLEKMRAFAPTNKQIL